MKIRKCYAATCLMAVFSISSVTNAALVSRLGGLAYYDDVADLTWLADANYAQTSGFDANGLMIWTNANNWAAGLTVDGVDGWRLPDTVQPDASCNGQNDSLFFSYAYYCTGSEMGDLFYNALGNSAGSLSNTGPFSNIQSYGYWSATEFAPDDTLYAWLFYMSDSYQSSAGYQGNAYKSYNRAAWAVQSGDVSAVPVPAAVWLFGSGLIGLIGVARHKKNG